MAEAHRATLLRGHFRSEALGIEVDARRDGAVNDLQNLEGLASYMRWAGTADTYYKGRDETATGVTVEALEALRWEMTAYALANYQRKHALEAAIDAAATADEANEIDW